MADDNKEITNLRAQIASELSKQRDERNAIKKAQEELRQLRQEKSRVAAERAKSQEEIRKLNIELHEDREIAKDKSLSDYVREQARERISESNIAIRGRRSDISRNDAVIAGLGTRVQETLGKKEYSESMLSSSRTEQREIASRQRTYQAAENLSPKQLRNELSSSISPDSALEAMRASASARKMGGTSSEQRQIQEASSEFSSLFNSIKELRKSLATLTEGTEEHKRKQEELTSSESKAVEALTKLTRLEEQIEKRKLSEGGTLGRAAQSGLSAMGGVARLGSDIMGGLGPQATERYVLEEQRKQSQLQLQNMALSDTRNRTRDATSFLSSGGGSLFGAEMPFDRKGRTTGAVQALGADYANTREAIPQYAVGLNALGGAFDVASNAVGEGIKGAAINPMTGWAAGGGALVQGGGKLGMQTLADVLKTPELAGRFGGGAAMGGIADFNSMLAGGIGTGLKFTGGGAVEWGGGNRGQFEGGVDKVTGGGAALMNGLPNVMKRAYDSVEQMNQLMSSEQQAGQAGRLRERLGMAFAPGMQQYMDAQGSIGASLRSSSMSKSEREQYERRLEMSTMDSDLGDRGFGVDEIAGNNASMAKMMGRFGRGGAAEAAAKQAMMGESMGLGDASMSMRAMGSMMGGGVKDPAAMMEKAMREGLMKGLQDSRSFQALLDAATQNADSAASFEGTLGNLLKLSGSGRASDTMTAQAAFKSISNDMSGMSGSWTDMVKFDVTNQAAKGVISGASKQGIELDREDRTSLQNLANLKPEDLQNEEFVKSSLTPNALKAVESQGGLKKYLSGLNNSLMAHGSLDRAINATQSKDLVSVRDMIKRGDKEGLKKMFSGPGGQDRLRKVLSQVQSGMSSTGDTNAAVGATQGVANMIGDATGIDTQAMGLFGESFDRKDVNQVRADSSAANTSSEQMRRGSAQISQQNMAIGTVASRGPNGENLFAAEQSKTGDMYGQQQSDMIKNVKDMKTVNPADQVARVDQAIKQIADGLKDMKESLKDFSTQKMIVNATQDIVIQGAQSIKGVILDNGLTQAATEAGKAIADTVKGAFSSNSPAPTPPPKPGAGKTPPGPVR